MSWRGGLPSLSSSPIETDWLRDTRWCPLPLAGRSSVPGIRLALTGRSLGDPPPQKDAGLAISVAAPFPSNGAAPRTQMAVSHESWQGDLVPKSQPSPPNRAVVVGQRGGGRYVGYVSYLICRKGRGGISAPGKCSLALHFWLREVGCWSSAEAIPPPPLGPSQEAPQGREKIQSTFAGSKFKPLNSWLNS